MLQEQQKGALRFEYAVLEDGFVSLILLVANGLKIQIICRMDEISLQVLHF